MPVDPRPSLLLFFAFNFRHFFIVRSSSSPLISALFGRCSVFLRSCFFPPDHSLFFPLVRWCIPPVPVYSPAVPRSSSFPGHRQAFFSMCPSPPSPPLRFWADFLLADLPPFLSLTSSGFPRRPAPLRFRYTGICFEIPFLFF